MTGADRRTVDRRDGLFAVIDDAVDEVTCLPLRAGESCVVLGRLFDPVEIAIGRKRSVVHQDNTVDVRVSVHFAPHLGEFAVLCGSGGVTS